jgi:transposase
LPSSVRILLCTVPQDMRRSFDGLALAAKEHLGEDPQSGALYVFVGKRPTRVKVLWWDKNGFCLLYKRLHRALFKLPDGQGPREALRRFTTDARLPLHNNASENALRREALGRKNWLFSAAMTVATPTLRSYL